jgi:hypothetical protein
MTSAVSNFVIKELSLVYKDKKIDLSGLFQELNIHDSILLPCVHGNVVILDSRGLTDKLALDGSENLIVDIRKNKSDDADSDFAFQKVFRIFRQSDRRGVNQRSEAYVLHFISEEFILSEQLRVNQSYKEKYSNIARSIMKDYLNIDIDNQIEDGGLFVESEGLKKIAIPNLHPIDAIDWCAKRCLDKNESPSFLFFENNKGYNFVSLSTLLSIAPVASLNFTPKNINLGDKTEETQFLGIKDFKVLSQFDFLKSVQNGVYAGKFIGFDPITRTIAQRDITFDDHYNTGEHGNKVPNLAVVENVKGLNNTQMFDARQSVYVFGYYRKDNEFINEKDPESLNYVDDPYKYIFQRRAIIQNLMTQRVQMVLPGNFQITSGVNVKLLVPKIGQILKNEDNLDKSLYGNHLIIATHHCIQPDKHEVVIEAVSDSSNREYGILSSKPIQDAGYNQVDDQGRGLI